MLLYRTVKFCIAVVMIITGIILTPMPIPFGILMIILGVALLATVSERVRKWITDLRTQFPAFSTALNNAKTRFPAGIQRLIEQTEPTIKNG